MKSGMEKFHRSHRKVQSYIQIVNLQNREEGILNVIVK